MKNKNAFLVIGIITAVVMIAIGFTAYITGQFFRPGLAYLVYVPMLGGLVWQAIAFSKFRDGFVTFGEVFASGMKMTVVIIGVILVWHLFTIVAMPEKKAKTMAYARQKLEEKQNLTTDQIDKAMSITEKIYYPILIAGEALGKAFFGLIFSLLGAAIAEKKGPRPYVPLDDSNAGYHKG